MVTAEVSRPRRPRPGPRRARQAGARLGRCAAQMSPLAGEVCEHGLLLMPGPVVVTGPGACGSGPRVVDRRATALAARFERICYAVERTCWIRPCSRIRVLAAKGLGAAWPRKVPGLSVAGRENAGGCRERCAASYGRLSSWCLGLPGGRPARARRAAAIRRDRGQPARPAGRCLAPGPRRAHRYRCRARVRLRRAADCDRLD